MRVCELLDLAAAPFDDQHGVGQVDVEVEVVHLGERAEAVCVDVDERQPSAPVHSGDDERRRYDPALHSEAGTDALHECRLSRAQRTGEHYEIAGTQDVGQLHSIRARIVHSGQPNGQCHPARHHLRRRPVSSSADAIRRPSASLTMSGYSSSATWPACGTTTSSALGSTSAIALLWSSGVMASRSPHMITTRVSASTGSAASLSCVINAG